jgi:mannonate dehydratase
LLLCVGSASEGLVNPKQEILEIIKHLGGNKKIFLIHLRNIKGSRNRFQEVFPDEGDVDFYQVVKALRDVEYPYMIMPDHMPTHPDDPGGRWGGRQAFAFGYGYIKALIQSVNSEIQSS